MAILDSPSSKSPILTRDRVSSPSRSHFSPGLKLILRNQVTNPEIATFQSLSKGVYGINTNITLLQIFHLSVQFFFTTKFHFSVSFSFCIILPHHPVMSSQTEETPQFRVFDLPQLQINSEL